MAGAAPQRLTPQEYLPIERAAETRSEFYAGEMVAMAGAVESHTAIITNAVLVLGTQLRGRPCRAYPIDMRVKISETGLYTYPDLVVVCGERRFQDNRRDTLLNPTLIIEVLSSATEAYDRGEKFAHYRRLESLQEYLLVAQDRRRVERFLRQGSDWILTEVRGEEGVLNLPSIGCALALADIYEGVELDPEVSLR